MDPNSAPQVNQPPVNTNANTPTSLAQPIVQAANDLANQPQPQAPARAKETGPATANELAGYVEVVGTDSLEKEPLPPEVSSWMEKVSRDTTGEKPPEIVVADHTTPPTAEPVSSKQVFVLPLGEQAQKMALHQGVSNSVRWLAEWCKRLVKKLGDQTTFQ